ncbi:MAG: hypothetical protein H6662_04220 [Ardenticatenaceae bacterium]|nr:hypothetical protein [Anaerolineales bacterium]MCB8920769.1 hypothetical protein [Ardenticatenaceae bacterium]MCB8989728.1 hypothetical protein [Ardenticatenaceae bacterium]MCB9002813.1 hypothetical protein [Ardenticatenaceae bacterium]
MPDSTAAPVSQRFPLLTFTENSVAVLVELLVAPTGELSLVGTYTPTEPLLHLYGMDMPLHGIDGVGRPTRLDVISETAVSHGPLVANVTPTLHYFSGFEQPFSLYPDGQVVLTLPISLDTLSQETPELELSVTYMACSSGGGCEPPVTDRRFVVTIPAEIWQDLNRRSS